MSENYEDASLVPWTPEGIKDTDLGCPPIHHHLNICHPIRILTKLVLDVPVPLGCRVVVLDGILDGELEDLKKCLSHHSL